MTELQEQQQPDTRYVIQRTEKPNSYEFGKAGNRFKLYFDDPHDLKRQMDKLTELGIYIQDE